MLTEHVLGSCPEVFMFHNTECIPELELCPEVFMFLNTECVSLNTVLWSRSHCFLMTPAPGLHILVAPAPALAILLHN